MASPQQLAPSPVGEPPTDPGEDGRGALAFAPRLGARREAATRGAGPIIIVGLALRIVWMFQAAAIPQFGDGRWYFHLGETLARGDGFIGPEGCGTNDISPFCGIPSAFYPPGYPFVLAAGFFLADKTWLPDSHLVAAMLINLILVGITLWLIVRIGTQAGGRTVGLLAAWIVALWPNHIFHSSLALTEPLFTTTVLAVLVLLYPSDGAERPTTRRLLVAGALLGFAVMTRPVAQLVIVSLVAIWLLQTRSVRETVRRLGLVLIAGALVIAPWAVRNAYLLDEFAPVGYGPGMALCVGNNPDATGGFGFFDSCEFDIEGALSAKEMRERNRTNQRLAVEWIRENPDEQLRLVPQRLLKSFKDDHDGLTNGGRHDFRASREVTRSLRLLAQVFYFPFLAFSIVGSALVWRRSAIDRALVIIAIGLVVPVMAFWGTPRYHMPILVLLAIPAASAVLALRNQIELNYRPVLVTAGDGVPMDMTATTHPPPAHEPISGTQPQTIRTRRRVFLAIEAAVVIAALAVLATAYIRATGPSANRTVISATFESSEQLSPGAPWAAVGGTWRQADGSLGVAPASPDRAAFLLAPVPTKANLLELSLDVQGFNAGAVFRYVDEKNHWALVNRPNFGTWAILRVVDGDATQESMVSSILGDAKIAVSWDAESIVVDNGTTSITIIDDAMGDATEAGLVLHEGGDRSARWGALAIHTIAPLEIEIGAD